MSFSDYWVCPACKSLNRDRVKSCYSCHTSRPAEGTSAGVYAPPSQATPTWGMPPSPTVPTPNVLAPSPASTAAPSSPAPSMISATGASASAAPMSGPSLAPGGIFAPSGLTTASGPLQRPEPAAPANILGGLIGGGAGAMIATLLWFGFVALTGWEVGLVAIAVGAIVAYGVVLGADGRVAFALIPISLVLTLAALLASEYLIILKVGNEVAAGFGVPLEAATATDPVSLITLGIRLDPGSLLFWGIALIEAFVIPWRRIMGRP